MKKTYGFFLFLILLSCNKREEEQIYQKLHGFWFNEDKILLFRDSLMLHPISNDAPGLFEFTVNNDILIVNNRQLDVENTYDSCYIKLEKENELTLIIDDLAYQFQRYESAQSMVFQRLNFEVEPCHGTCPVFEVEIISDGTVNFNGKAYTEIIGSKVYKLDIEIINEINDLLEVVKIADYPEEKFSSPPGSPRFNLIVEYPNDLEISIIDGLFGGKYESIINYFYFFETQLLEKHVEKGKTDES